MPNTIKVSFDTRGLAKLLNTVEREILDEMKDTASRVAQREMRANAPVDKGRLRRSVRQIRRTARSVTVATTAGYTGATKRNPWPVKMIAAIKRKLPRELDAAITRRLRRFR